MKILITLSLLFIGLTTFAQNVSMTIFNNSGQQFFVVMNGIRQNSLPQTNVKIGGMTTGSYEIKLIFADGKTGDINKKIYVDAAGNYLARVVFKGKKRKLQYFGVTDNNQMPAGGTDIQYRPNDQSVYSDQTVGLNTNGQSGTVNQSGQNTQGSGQTTTLQSGTVGTTTTTTTIPDPNIPSGTQTTTTTSGSQSGTMGSGTTISDPNNPNGQLGMNININIQDPSMNGGVGGVSTSTSTSGAGNGGMSTTTTVSDPNNPNGNFGVNMNVSGTGLVNETSTSTTTTTSSSTITQNGQVVEDTHNYNQSTSVTQNGQTTTTTQSSQSGNNGQGVGTTQISMNGNGTSTSTQGNGSPVGNGYSCTSVLVDGDAFVARLKNETFDADKREMIETELKMQCVSADQAYKIINGLTFPEDRLEMSKFLYDRMTDRVNGVRLVELLTFDMDKEEFQTYMKTKN